MDDPDETAPSSTSVRRPRREPFAAGDGLTRYPPGGAFALRIDSPWEKPWQARLPGGAMAPPFPGTTVLFEEELYEVVRAESTGAGRPYIYLLRPWEEAAPPRQVVAYTALECERAARERAEHLRRLRRGHGLSWLSPLVGLLPGEDQRRIERDYNVSASRATLLSALVLLGLAIVGFARGLATLLTGTMVVRDGLAWDTLLPLSSYFMVESMVRLGAAGYAGEPLGSLFVALPVLAIRTVAAAIAGRRERRSRPAEWSSRFLLDEAQDEVTPLPDGRLEILSLLPKPHWGGGTGVRHEGRWYRLEIREVVEREGRERHRFVLEEEPEAHLLRSVVEYRPEEVRDLYRQGLLYRKRTWVETFAPLWGLLDAGLQRRLAEIYGFDALRHTAWSAAGVGIFALFDALVALRYLASRQGGPGDLLALLASACFLYESLTRLRAWRRGDPAGSVLGWMLAPLARRLVV